MNEEGMYAFGERDERIGVSRTMSIGRRLTLPALQ
jgi:hypothetical protein